MKLLTTFERNGATARILEEHRCAVVQDVILIMDLDPTVNIPAVRRVH